MSPSSPLKNTSIRTFVCHCFAEAVLFVGKKTRHCFCEAVAHTFSTGNYDDAALSNGEPSPVTTSGPNHHVDSTGGNSDFSLWQFVLIALATLILCSCQTMPPVRFAPPEPSDHLFDVIDSSGPASLHIRDASPLPISPAPDPSSLSPGDVDLRTAVRPHPAFPISPKPFAARPGTSIGPPGTVCPPPVMPGPTTLPMEAYTGTIDPNCKDRRCRGAWAPPGIECPWPKDEYIFDGGDEALPVRVGKDWTVYGLDSADTVVHYDTVDGKTQVAPSNRISIYSPRFASVRKVTGAIENHQQDQLVGVDLPVRLGLHEDLQLATTAIQPVQPVGRIGSKAIHIFRERLRGVGLEGAQGLAAFQYGILPYENLQIIRHGTFLQSEKARLAQAADAALVWSNNQAVEVVIDEQMAATEVHDSKPQLTYQYELPPGKPRLRVVKVASSREAKPGETIDFTIRFDNVGDQPIGNVTIIDNLTTRLEYVPDSAQSTLDANFLTQLNEGESLVLRWEIDAPLKPGKGGVVRFTCKVR